MRKAVLLMGMIFLISGCGKAASATGETLEDAILEEESVTMEDAVEESTKAEVVMEEAPTEQNMKTTTTESGVTEESAEESVATEAETEETVKEITEKITAFEEKKTVYATIALNVRRGPSTEYEVISHLAMGQAIEITGQAETGWYQLMIEGTPAYVSNKYISENKVEIPVTSAPVVNSEQNAVTQGATPAPAAVAPAGVIMVGDSRCVQMQAAVGGGGCSWVCENSKEYTWFSETAIPKFDQYVGNGTKVVINMGVNDPEHYKQYVELINAKAAEWAQRGAKTYLVSVNPVWENPYTTQEQVDTFNANVPGMLVGVTWIDTSTWLNANGYRLLDGLHYDDPTYVNIFNLIIGSL